MSGEQVRKRHIERHCAAAIRALAAHPAAEFRRDLLFDGHRGVALMSPHLALDVGRDSLVRCRGVADAMALRLIHTDLELHGSLMPPNAAAAMVFDILEQLRVESLAPQGLRGLRRNLDDAFNEWCRKSRASGFAENEFGLVVYSITQIVRSRLTGAAQDEEVEGLIESTRFRLGPLIGDALKALPRLRHDQQAYARHALAIAQVAGNIADALGGVELQTARAAQRMLLPRQHSVDERYTDAAGAGAGTGTGQPGESGGRYRVFCRDHDREVGAREVVPLASRRRVLRADLDRLVKAQAVSVPRLAQRLKTLFSAPEYAGWNFGEEDGYLDGRRLSQIVANPAYSRIFRQRQRVPRAETVVSFLIDNSGSMKRLRYEAVAVLVDIYSRALDLAGVPNEVLGFTTGGWTGGQSIETWRRAGSPDSPGRLNDRLHVVYKDAATPWRRAREGIAALLSTNHFREGLDGEALEWAAGRLTACEANRRCLVMISDGAPMDSATGHHNPPGFLDGHLRDVIQRLEGGGGIELRGIGVNLDLGDFYAHSLVLDLAGTLGNAEFRALESLYRGHRLQ